MKPHEVVKGCCTHASYRMIYSIGLLLTYHACAMLSSNILRNDILTRDTWASTEATLLHEFFRDLIVSCSTIWLSAGSKQDVTSTALTAWIPVVEAWWVGRQLLHHLTEEIWWQIRHDDQEMGSLGEGSTLLWRSLSLQRWGFYEPRSGYTRYDIFTWQITFNASSNDSCINLQTCRHGIWYN